MVSRTPCGYYQGTLGYPGLDLDFVVRGQSRSTSSRVRQRHCLQDPQETRRGASARTSQRPSGAQRASPTQLRRGDPGAPALAP